VHVISQDFSAPGLKNKKHWNSFTTAFFVPIRTLIADIEAAGKVTVCRRAE
jgi:aprataxin